MNKEREVSKAIENKTIKNTIKDYGIVNQEGKPAPAAFELLDILQLPHNKTLSGVVENTQKKFFQKKEDGQRKERWELEEVMPEFKNQIMPKLDQLGMLQEFSPSKKNYSGALVLGGFITRARSRISSLKELWEKGVRVNEVIFLGGERPLAESGKETTKELFDRTNTELPIRKDWQEPLGAPTTELGMMKLVWDQADLPEDLKNLKSTWINAPMKLNPKGGNLLRPTTEDVLKTWLKTNPSKGTFLAISNNPHIGYQQSVLETYLPNEIQVETVGQKAPQNLSMAFYLGEFSRWLYQEQQRLKSK